MNKITIVDVEKTSAGPERFSQGYKWSLVESSASTIEHQCEDPTLLDLSSSKYSEKWSRYWKKGKKEDGLYYEICTQKFIREALQPKK